MNLLCLGDERVLSQFSVHVGETWRLDLATFAAGYFSGFFFLFLPRGGGRCEGSFKLPHLFFFLKKIET